MVSLPRRTHLAGLFLTLFALLVVTTILVGAGAFWLIREDARDFAGRSAEHWRKITVHHRSAASADALSTAIYAASATEIVTLLERFTGAAVWAVDHEGQERYWSSGAVPGIQI